MAVAVEPGAGDIPGVRRRIALSATGVLVGVAVSLMVDQTIGAWLTTTAFALLLLALHRFGRSGPA